MFQELEEDLLTFITSELINAGVYSTDRRVKESRVAFSVVDDEQAHFRALDRKSATTFAASSRSPIVKLPGVVVTRLQFRGDQSWNFSRSPT